MYTVTRFPHGTFSWADCMTTDAVAGSQFYAALMGWEIDEVPMGEGMGSYYMFQRDGHYVAALSQYPPNMMDRPPWWNSYITVDDIDALAPRIAELGGKVFMGPDDVFDAGRMLMLQGPDGAVLSLWQPRNHIGAGLVNTPGALCWNELYTKDAEVSKPFYSALLGWEFMPHPDTPAYHMILNNGRMNGGVFTMNEEMQAQMPPMWMPYFSVADIVASSVRVKALGGAVHIDRQPAGEGDNTVGVFSLFTDPQGAHCYLIQLNQIQPWLEHESDE